MSKQTRDRIFFQLVSIKKQMKIVFFKTDVVCMKSPLFKKQRINCSQVGQRYDLETEDRAISESN